MGMKYEELPRDEKTKAIVAEDVEFPIHYTLMSPVEINGVMSAEIDVCELTVGEIEATNRERDLFRQTVLLVANALHITPEDVRGMRSRDYGRLSRLVSAFL